MPFPDPAAPHQNAGICEELNTSSRPGEIKIPTALINSTPALQGKVPGPLPAEVGRGGPPPGPGAGFSE